MLRMNDDREGAFDRSPLRAIYDKLLRLKAK
jgi:hypothetical protein